MYAEEDILPIYPEEKYVFYARYSTVDIRPQVPRLQMCTVTPSLPEGIVIDSACAITGIPMKGIPETLFTVTAMTESGKISTEISIEIRDSPYSQSHYSFVKGVFGTTGIPQTSEPAFNWMISPSLPTGLMMNGETGEISGIPVTSDEDTKYSIIAMTESGKISTEISIEIREPLCFNEHTKSKAIIGETRQYDCTQDNMVGVESRICVLGKNDGEWKLVSGHCRKQIKWSTIMRHGLVTSYVMTVVACVVFAVVMIIRKKKAAQPPAMDNQKLMV